MSKYIEVVSDSFTEKEITILKSLDSKTVDNGLGFEVNFARSLFKIFAGCTDATANLKTSPENHLAWMFRILYHLYIPFSRETLWPMIVSYTVETSEYFRRLPRVKLSPESRYCRIVGRELFQDCLSLSRKVLMRLKIEKRSEVDAAHALQKCKIAAPFVSQNMGHVNRIDVDPEVDFDSLLDQHKNTFILDETGYYFPNMRVERFENIADL